MQKIYVLDTNILLTSPRSLYSFEDNTVIIPDIVLEELDKKKTERGELGFNAREAIRGLETLRQQGSLLEGVPLDNGGKVQIIPYKSEWCSHPRNPNLVCGFQTQSPDEKILDVCGYLAKQYQIPVILVSNDINMRIRAQIQNIDSQEYRSDSVSAASKSFLGRIGVEVLSAVINRFYEDGQLPVGELGIAKPIENEFVLLKAIDNDNQSAIGQIKGNSVVKLNHATSNPWGIYPKNVGQKFAIDALMNEKIPLVILKGPAGTAKTFLTLAAALEQVTSKVYDNILVVRPNVEFDAGIGFLPGSESDKIDALIRPVYDNLKVLCKTASGKPEAPDTNYVQDLFDRGIITAQAMNFMRGRSLSRTFLIIDEAQNMTPTQAFGIISRIGMGSKVVLAGDPDQIDNPNLDRTSNGLSFASDRMKNSPLCAQMTFSDTECVRSPLALEAIQRMSPKGVAK